MSSHAIPPIANLLMSGLVFGESPRWRHGRFWVSDWAVHEIIALELDGRHEVVLRENSFPLCMDFMVDGSMVVMSGRRVLRRELGGTLVLHGDLGGISQLARSE